LFFEPFRLACPLDHPLAQRVGVRLRDLTRGKLLLMEEGHCMRDQATCAKYAGSIRTRAWRAVSKCCGT
jgi:LysR family hydrogen peroxide-inducible transcriptional activator